MPSMAGTDTVKPVVAAGVVSCVERRGRYVGCAMGVAAARAFAEPVPPSTGMAKPEAKTVSAAGEIDPRPVQNSVVATGAETRANKSPRGSRKAVNPYTWLVRAKLVKCGRVGRESTQGSMFSAGHEPTQDGAFGEGTSPPRQTPGIGEEGARSPRVLRR